MFNFVVALLQALLLASSVFAAPVTDGADSVVKRAGPSGTLVQPKDGWGTVWNGGTISLLYQRVNAPGLETSSIDVFLIRKSKNYNHTLATYLTASDQQIFATFKVPGDLPNWPGGSDYQLQVWERQTDPGDESQLVKHYFPAAAPFGSISFAG